MVDLSTLQSVSYIAGALGVCVAAVFYVLNLRISRKNQELMLKAQQQNLETRQAQLLMQIFDRVNNKDFTRNWGARASRLILSVSFLVDVMVRIIVYSDLAVLRM
jgi:hypothetical protein